jgi:hypothetical protein
MPRSAPRPMPSERISTGRLVALPSPRTTSRDTCCALPRRAMLKMAWIAASRPLGASPLNQYWSTTVPAVRPINRVNGSLTNRTRLPPSKTTIGVRACSIAVAVWPKALRAQLTTLVRSIGRRIPERCADTMPVWLRPLFTQQCLTVLAQRPNLGHTPARFGMVETPWL